MKINFGDFIKQVKANSGHAEWIVSDVLNSAAVVLRNNLDDGNSTAVFKGMIVYPSTKKDCPTTFARARFGTFFKDLNSAIL